MNDIELDVIPPEDYVPPGEVVGVGYRRSREIKDLFMALAQAQSVFEAAEKSTPGQFGKYATVNDILEATKEGRKQNNLALIQIPSNGDEQVITLTTILGHSSGQWMESTLSITPSKYDAQGVGSVITYLRKYAAGAILGVGAEDDDGEAAVQPPAQRPVRPPRPNNPWRAPEPPVYGAPPSPHDPDTGEVGPRLLTLRETERGADFVDFGRRLIAAVQGSATVEEVDDWEQKNQAHINQAQGQAPKAFNSIFGALTAQRKKLTPAPEMLTEADAANILRNGADQSDNAE